MCAQDSEVDLVLLVAVPSDAWISLEAALNYDGRQSIGGIETRTLVIGEPTFEQ